MKVEPSVEAPLVMRKLVQANRGWTAAMSANAKTSLMCFIMIRIFLAKINKIRMNCLFMRKFHETQKLSFNDFAQAVLVAHNEIDGCVVALNEVDDVEWFVEDEE